MTNTKASRENPQPNAMDARTTAIKPQTIDASDDRGGSILGHIWASIGATLVLGVVCCGLYPLAIWAISQAVFPIQANGSLVKKDGTFTTDDTQAAGSYLIGQTFSAPGYFHPRPSAAGAGYDGANSGGSNLGPLSDKLINGATQTPPPAPAPAPSPAAAEAPAPSAPAAANAPASPPAETLAFDGIRLRVIHYCLENGIAFKLYRINADGARIAEVPLSKYQDKDGNLLDVKLVDDFPHPSADTADKTPVIAADFATLIPGDAVTGSGSGLDPHISPENAAIQAQRVADARKLPKEKVLELIEQNTDQPNLGFLGDPGVNVLMLNIAVDKVAPPAAVSAGAPSTAPTTK
ncbi:MAG: potassium-transporting ATPase subunit C [Thermoguttaceae bacterium]|jgi:K+-transporting ATPase ATPase C chain